MASNSIIQYASSSTSTSTRRYHVFVSFRGDTRNNFTDHLFGALRRNGIDFFKDDTKLKKGKHILPELLHAIEGSQILVVVFSKNYASSKWCLRELEKIASYIEVSEKHVLPIFYDVTPSEVRYQIGNYKEAFDKYKERFKEDKEKMKEVQRWRQTLLQVANLCGWDIGDKSQYEEIEKIVQCIKKLLQQNIVSFPNDDLVGIESPLEELEKLLRLDSDDVVMSLGICGMPGIGKTALVNALCNRIHPYFDFNCFIEDVSRSIQNSDICRLQRQLLYQAPEENSLEIYNTFPRTNWVGHGRRLIVLDNVDHIDQLEKLDLKHKHLGAGSRIIIISKDKGILENYGVNHVYDVQPLNHYDSIQLFNKHAFKGNYIMSENEKLKNDIFSYLGGHPLVIKVLGRHLAGQDISKWSTALAKLRENPKKDILAKLRISFDELEQNEKEIFLDIACFFNWYRCNRVFEILRFRGFDPESGLQTLLQKSLITYYEETWVEMPSLLIDLGKYIVKEKSPKEPRKWSRLWNYQDLLKVLPDNKPAQNLEGIVVYSEFSETTMKVDALSKMNQLKLLILNHEKFSGNLDDLNLSNELTYVSWKEYPFKCLPSSFQPNNLVELFMRYSNIKRLWKGIKPLPNLKRLDLSYSQSLVEMPNFEEASNLEELTFDGCIQLKEIHPSIGLLRKLTILNLEDCKSLVKMPDFEKASSLERLNFEGCTELRKIHPSVGSLKQLKCLILKYCESLNKMPDFGEASNLEWLNFEGCIELRKIHPSVGSLKQLKCLILKYCESLNKMPDFGEASNLEWLNFEECIELRKIHPSVGSLKQLTCLNLKNCKNLVSLPTSLLEVKCLEYLNLSGCSNLYNTQLLGETRDTKHTQKHYIDESPIHSQSTSSIQKKSFMGSVSCSLLWLPSFPCMRHLDLSFCNLHQIPDAIGNLSCLERLNLRGNKFAKMPNLKKLSKLIHINLEHCKQLKYLFKLPSRTDLTAELCYPPSEVESEFALYDKWGLNIFNCPELVKSEEWSRMTISWMIQILQEKLQKGIFVTVESVIPGNEIARWFNNQHVRMDDSIKVDSTPLTEEGNNWIGIAFCAVFVSHHQNNSGNNQGLDWSFPKQGFIPYSPQVLLDVDLVTHKSDHMCLFYFSRSHFISAFECHGAFDSANIEVKLETKKPYWNFEVKKYGYRWVYEEDLQPSNIVFKNSSNRKRKFLEIKDRQ